MVRPRPIQGDGHVDFLGELEGFLPQPQYSLEDAGEATNDFCPCREASFTAITLNQESTEESCPIPLKYIDVSKTTHTNLDVKQEKRIEENWNIDGSRDLSVPWTGFTQFILLEEEPSDGYMWSRERLTRNSIHPGGIIKARTLEVNGKERQAEGKAKVGWRKAPS